MEQVTIEVRVSCDIADALLELAGHCNSCRAIMEGLTSYGANSTTAILLAMLAEDVAMIAKQPDSWQSANMMHLLASHGYHVRNL